MAPLKLGIPAVPGLGRDLVAVAILATAGSIVMGAFGPIMPMYLDTIGLDVKTIGLLIATGSVAVAIGEFSWGWAMDRIHLRLPLAVGTLGLACVLLGFTFTQALPLLFLLVFLRGCTFVATVPGSRAFVGCSVGVHQKALFLGLFQTLVGAGRTLGAFAGGYVAMDLGYLAVFVVCAAIAGVGGLVGLPLLRARRLTHYSDKCPDPAFEAIGTAKSVSRETASFKAQGLLAILAFVPTGVSGTFIPLLAKKVILLQPSEVGIIYAISGLVTMALTLPMGRLADRYGRRLFMVAGLATMGISIFGVSFASSGVTLLTCMMLSAVGMAAFSPAALALLSDTAPADRQGVAMGLYGVCEDIGIIAGPAIGGILWESFGPQPTFWFGAVPTLVGAMVALAVIRRRSLLLPAKSFA